MGVRKLCKSLQTFTEREDIIDALEDLVNRCQAEGKSESRKQRAIDSDIMATLKTLLEHSDESIVLSATKLFGVLLAEFTPAQNAAIQSGMPSVVFTQVLKHKEHLGITERLTRSIWGMAEADIVTPLISDECVKTLSQIIESDELSVLRLAVGALLTLCGNDKFVRLIEKSDLMKKFVNVINKAKEDQTLARFVGGFIINACDNDVNQQSLMRSNGIEALVELLKKFEDNVVIVAKLLRGFRSITSENQSVLSRVISVSESLIEVGKKHDDNDDVVESLLGIIFNFSLTESEEELVNKKCTKAVADLMDKCEEGMKLALGYLMNLSTCDEACEDMVKDARIMKSVKKAMDKHEDDAKVILRGCGYVQNASAFEEGKQQIIETEIIHDVVEGMKKNINEEDVVKSCLLAVVNMATDPDLAEILAKEEIAKELDNVLDHSKDQELVRLALTSILNLSTCGANIVEYMEEDWAKHIIEVMDKFNVKEIRERALYVVSALSPIQMMQEKFVEHDVFSRMYKYINTSDLAEMKTIAAISNLTKHPQAAKMIVESKVLEKEKEIIQKTVQNGENFAAAITNLAIRVELHDELVKFANVVLEIIKAKKSERGLVSGLKAILNLCMRKESREQMRGLNIMETLCGILSAYKTNKLITFNVLNAMTNTCADEEMKKDTDKYQGYELVNEVVEIYKDQDDILDRCVNFYVQSSNGNKSNSAIMKQKSRDSILKLKEYSKNQKTLAIIDQLIKRVN